MAKAFVLLLISASLVSAAPPPELKLGVAGHAFDHLGGFANQQAAAAASGANIIYVTGLGGVGYSGLPAAGDLQSQRKAAAEYVTRAKRNGIKLAIGYICATSIVKLDAFDKKWSAEFRKRFRAPPSAWLQQGKDGKPLASWYGGDYFPACMNNPDWRAYEAFMVRQQLETGCDGIFFDNPTVHPEGCYCVHCLNKFADWLRGRFPLLAFEVGRQGKSPEVLRALAQRERDVFLQFRCTIARDFLAEMRRAARQIKPRALVTANNSLNSAQALYSQCRYYAYNILEMSQAEDFVVVEDMSSQPRVLANGRTLEYGPTYKQLQAISHGKPVVAVTLAEADYHTPPNLVRLAMAEAAANQASHLWWPTWPQDQRDRMVSLVRPEAEFLRQHADLLNHVEPRPEVLVFLPFRNWLKGDTCRASGLAAELSKANLQYQVICEEAFAARNKSALTKQLQESRVFLAATADLFEREREAIAQQAKGGVTFVSAETPDWLAHLRLALREPAITVKGFRNIRAVVLDQKGRTIIHLLNLNVQRLSSFEDKVDFVQDLELTVSTPFSRVHSVRSLTADTESTAGPLEFTATRRVGGSLVTAHVPRLSLSAIVVVE